jgi:hypothetical protein
MTRSRHPSSIALRAATLVAVLLVPAGLRAAGDEAGARVLFLEARKLAAAGDYAAACPKFEDSYRLDPGIGTNFNLADCYEHSGRIASAWARFLDVAAATKAAGQLDRERVARARAEALEPKLARMTLKVEAKVPGVSVVRDGIEVGAAAWQVAVPIDPGPHLIEASAPGRIAWKTTVEVREGPGAVTVVVPDLAEAPLAEPAPSPAVAATPSSSVADLVTAPPAPQRRWSRPVVILGAIGAAAVLTGAAFGIKFEMDNGEAEAICGGTESSCPSTQINSHTELVDSANTDLKLEIVGLAVGGAALLTAGYLWWREVRHEHPAPAPRPAVAAVPFGQLGLALGGNW